MNEVIAFKYNKTYAWLMMPFAIIMFLFLSITILLNSFDLKIKGDLLPIIFMDCIYLIATCYVAVVQFIPAIKNQNIIEIDSTGITYHIYKIKVSWENIKEIKSSFWTNSVLIIKVINPKLIECKGSWFYRNFIVFHNRMFFADPLRIPLNLVEGKNKIIVSSTLAYYDKIKRVEH